MSESTESVTIIVKNVKSKLTGISPTTLNLLSKELSIRANGYFFSTAYRHKMWDGYEHFLSRPANTFPTGLLPMVINFLKESCELNVILKDERKSTHIVLNPVEKKFKISEYKISRDYQVDAMNSIFLGKVEGIPFPRGVINIATNGGKTLIAEGVIKNLYDQLQPNEVFLFLTHSKEIAFQAQKSILNDLGIEVGFIGSSQWDVKPITVAIITTLHRRLKDKKDEFMKLKDNVIGFVADECHHTSSESWNAVLNKFDSAYIRFGLTGTVDKKNRVNEMKLYSCTGNILIKISNDFLINEGVSAKPICVLFKVSVPELGDLEYQDAYQAGIVSNIERNELIYEICKKETDAGNTVLVLVEYIEHGKNIEEFLQLLNRRVHFTNGSLSNQERADLLDRLKDGDLDVLISSNILDEGVDVSGINAIVYARGLKSPRKLLQGLGRGLRLKSDNSNLRFYDFIDDTHRKLLEHSKQRFDILVKEKFQIKLMNVVKYREASWKSLNLEF